ncbi:hypothetical protein M405DRAFT_899743, partial [Rhizopogon salebrosus TDB-379]
LDGDCSGAQLLAKTFLAQHPTIYLICPCIQVVLSLRLSMAEETHLSDETHLPHVVPGTRTPALSRPPK